MCSLFMGLTVGASGPLTAHRSVLTVLAWPRTLDVGG